MLIKLIRWKVIWKLIVIVIWTWIVILRLISIVISKLKGKIGYQCKCR